MSLDFMYETAKQQNRKNTAKDRNIKALKILLSLVLLGLSAYVISRYHHEAPQAASNTPVISKSEATDRLAMVEDTIPLALPGQ